MNPITAPLTLITGSSRGMGEAMALRCLRDGHRVIGIARHESAALAAAAAAGQLQQWQADLAEAAPLGHRLGEALRVLARDAGRRQAPVTLINNAGLIAPLRPLEDIDAADTVLALRVGLEAAMVLTGAFLDATRDWTGPRRVLNISSGLGRRAMAGSASYCAAKAGMDHFSRAVALEQADRPNGARVVSLAPGVIDTDMQAQLRASDPSRFAARGDFVRLKEQAQLLSPDAAAERVLAFLARSDFGAAAVADVRDPA